MDQRSEEECKREEGNKIQKQKEQKVMVKIELRKI